MFSGETGRQSLRGSSLTPLTRANNEAETSGQPALSVGAALASSSREPLPLLPAAASTPHLGGLFGPVPTDKEPGSPGWDPGQKDGQGCMLVRRPVSLGQRKNSRHLWS